MTSENRLEAGLATLVNQCGKLRMLSHRSMMMFFLANSGEETADNYKQELTSTYNAFLEIAKLVSGETTDHSEATLAAQYLQKNRVFPKEELHQLRHFARNMAKLMEHIETGNFLDHRAAADLADFVAGPLLATLNQMVAQIEAELKKLTDRAREEADRKNALISKSITEIDKTTQLVFMISLNASIEASRLGEAGMGFNQIVKEIRKLSSHMGKVAGTLKSEILGE